MVGKNKRSGTKTNYRGPSREVKWRVETPICILTDKRLGHNTARVEVVGLSCSLYMEESIFMRKFVAGIVGLNAHMSAVKKIPGLIRHVDGNVKWRFDIDTFTKNAPVSQKALLQSICRPGSIVETFF